uniref:Odorant receptor n=1 Tax=Aulacocentrum confusum TaxID=2767324 RepID=A0A7G8Z976_9HYME|nr:olfactory receptor 57 [Aulacocentrum confusum]
MNFLPYLILEVYNMHFIMLQFFMVVSLFGLLTDQDCDPFTDDYLATAFIFCGILTIAKITLIRLNQNRMLEVILTVINDWTRIKSLEARNIMMKNAKFGKTIFITYMTFSGIAIIPNICEPIISPAVTYTINSTLIDRNLGQLPLTNVCFNETMSYTALYVLQSVQILLIWPANVGSDCYFFGITMHIVGQFECLSVDFKNLGKCKNSETFRKYLAEYVQRHSQLLRLSTNLENTFNVIFLFQISASIMEICMTGLRMIVSIRTKDPVATLNFIIIIIVLMVQIFLYCYSGSCLTIAAKNLKIATYFSNWYELSPSISKDLMFVIIRASKTFSLTAGHIIEMNLESFTNILKAVGSYFSVLQAMVEV